MNVLTKVMEKSIYLREWFLFFILLNANIKRNEALNCGCKALRQCYKTMVEELITHDEASCISDAAIGTSTVLVFLKAIYQYCSEIIELYNEKSTYEGRYLYKVIVRTPLEADKEDERPVIVIDAGQEAGSDSVGFALYIIEQLVSCEESNDMIKKFRWVILPATNPDGQEYARQYKRAQWRKNMRPTDDGISFGVDISRNFEGDWKSCPKVLNGYSSVYPGSTPASENETIFIQEVLQKYRKYTKLYLSIRKDGHSINFPQASDSAATASRSQLERVAGLVATKVNQRAGGVHLFTNQSMYELNGQPRCGHSVDYAHQFISITHTYEMRVFLGSENRMMMKFQTLPRGYETTLRNGYYSAIRELFNIITKDNNFKNF